MRTVLIVLACAGCGSSKETPGTSSDDEPVTEPAGMAAGRKAPGTDTDGKGDEPKPGGGSGGSRSEETPEAGSASQAAAEGGAPAIEKATEFDAGKDPARNKVTAAQLCERLATINCAGEAFCCDTPNRTVEACKQDLITTCSMTLMLDKIAMQESSRFDAAAAEKAYTELESRASKCDPSVAQWGGSADGLRGILKGSIEPKASCMPSATLDPVQVGAALVACAQPETHACVYATVLDPWTCQPRSADGGVCVTDNNCIDGLYCYVQTPGIAGLCKTRKAVGDACASPTECSSLFCKKSKCVEADQQAAYCLIN
jgi:hypothetical protein